MNEQCVIYVRLSLDRHGDELGIDRQEDECRAKAEEWGWEVLKTYRDNDLSATTGVLRPGFEALLAEVEPPVRVLCWHQDRFVRLTTELQRVMDKRLHVHSIYSGMYDLSTPGGRATAMTITTWAQYEGEQKSERQKAAARQRARMGKRWWPSRPFGFEMDGTHRDHEAAALQDAYTQLLAGGTITSIVRDLVAAGHTTNKGNPWTAGTFRPILMNARNAGIRVYNGEEIGKAAWEPIVPEDTWRKAVMLLEDPRRRTNGGGGGRGHRKHLLTGVAQCGKCGSTVKVAYRYAKALGFKRRVYACTRHCVTAWADWADERALAVVIARVQRGDVANALAAEAEDTGVRQASLQYELADLEQKAAMFTRLLIAGSMTEAQYADANTEVIGRIEEIRKDLAGLSVDEVLRPLVMADDVHAHIEGLDINTLNAICEAFYERIEFMPRGKGVHEMKPEDMRMFVPGDEGPIVLEDAA